MSFGKRFEDLEITNNSDLLDLITLLIEKYGEEFRENIFSPSGDNLRDDVLLNINGKPSRQLQGLYTKLNNKDEVGFMPIFSGGG
jgi:molybdopterin converting factor small subunit